MDHLPSRIARRGRGGRTETWKRAGTFRPHAEPLEDRLTPTNLPPGFTESLLADNLVSPTAMEFAPDGRLFIVEQRGDVRILKDGQLLARPFLSIAVDDDTERGMLGIAFDPDFIHNHYVYIQYTARTPTVHNRISRFTAQGDEVVPGSEFVVMELDTQSDNPSHVGGAIHFGPDGKLYIAQGDNGQSTRAQLLDNTFGKILRINPDGSTPPDNPFFDAGLGVNPNIWAYGLRNPFTFAIQPGTGRIFVNDVGEATWEEIDQGAPGANFGWPLSEGYTTHPGFTSPVFAYQHGPACAITAGVFYNPEVQQFPSAYAGKYIFADFCAGWLHLLDPVTHAVSDFVTDMDPFVVDLKVDPGGSLYYLSRGLRDGGIGKVLKIEFPTAQPPHVTFHPVPQTVAVGEPATFTVSASGSPPLSYQWRRNNVDIPGATSSTYTLSSPQLSDNGAVFRAVVTSSLGTATSNGALLTVLADTPPTATILLPTIGQRYAGGDLITYSANATDAEDGVLPAGAFTWQVVFHHDEHTHPFIPPTTGSKSGTFTIPTSGEKSSNVWFEIILTVTDSSGLTYQTSRAIFPETAQITLATTPPGLQVMLDGQPLTTPATITGVVGINRTVSIAPSQVSNGLTYTFEGWADGGDPSHTFSLPDGGITQTAVFHMSKVGDGTGLGDNQLYVSGLYHDLLGRPVDDFGISAFASQLDQARRPVLNAIAQDFVTSTEERGKVIRDAYLTFLGRGASQNEVNLWLRAFASGQSMAIVRSQIAGSDEAFQRQNQDPAQWLNVVFRGLLGRDAGPGSNIFQYLVRAGTPRSLIVLAVLDSDEYRTQVIASAYQTYLGRAASPQDVSGWLGWTHQFQTTVGPLAPTERFVTAILASDEFFRRSGNANGGWVDSLYNVFLGRAPDEDGLRGNIVRLHNGYAAARQNVAGVIQRTDEFLGRKVRDYYSRFLGRQAGPDEVARWVQSLHQGATLENIIAIILSSDEYFRRHQGTNKDWLDAVFLDAFNRIRDPDPSNSLLVALNNGTSRLAVATFIVTSNEYQTKVVTDFFRTYMDRVPGGGEIAFGVSSQQLGARDEQLLSVLLASEEYFQVPRTYP